MVVDEMTNRQNDMAHKNNQTKKLKIVCTKELVESNLRKM
jgi:hypothetical protein